jgi:1-acyl-sn-glycerol-3-phosphate acyltransferase
MKSKIRLLYKVFLVVVLFFIGFVIAVLVFPLIDSTCSSGQARSSRDFIKMLWLQCFGLILNLQISRRGSMPFETGLIVSNHVSWLDIVVIGQYLPAYFVAKSDILGWPVIGYLAKQAGTIFIRRGDKKNILITSEKMLCILRQHANIIAFPEGTTTKGGDVLSFHASLFQPALLAKSIVQPVAIKYKGMSELVAPFIGDDAFVPHLLKILELDKVEAELNVLALINHSGKNRNIVCKQARALILNEIKGEAANF